MGSWQVAHERHRGKWVCLCLSWYPPVAVGFKGLKIALWVPVFLVGFKWKPKGQPNFGGCDSSKKDTPCHRVWHPKVVVHQAREGDAPVWAHVLCPGVVSSSTHNADPGLINPFFLIWGCPPPKATNLHENQGHPHINKQGAINPGSTIDLNATVRLLGK